MKNKSTELAQTQRHGQRKAKSSREQVSGIRRTQREREYSSELQPVSGQLCLWCQLDDALDQERDPGRNLLKLPPLLHRQAEADRHRRTHRALPAKVWQEDRRGDSLIAFNPSSGVALRPATTSQLRSNFRHGKSPVMVRLSAESVFARGDR